MTTINLGYEIDNKGAWDWPLQQSDGTVQVTNTKEKFEVELNVQFFKPEEIEVKIAGNDILINCRHDPRSDEYGSVSREIFRAYKLSPDVDGSTLKTHLSSEGLLKITAMKH